MLLPAPQQDSNLRTRLRRPMGGEAVTYAVTCENMPPADLCLESLSRLSRGLGVWWRSRCDPADQRGYPKVRSAGLAVDLVQQGPSASRCASSKQSPQRSYRLTQCSSRAMRW